MYLGIDIGGTKTLVAVLSDEGKIVQEAKFSSNHDYQTFLSELGNELQKFDLSAVTACCAAVPGLLDREKGIEIALGNLPWINQYIMRDISQLINGLPVLIENDTRLAGLYEARLLKDEYEKVLYFTISTGIGGALINKGGIVRILQDTEMGKSPLLHDGKVQHWEDFAGGRGVVSKFGKKASEINDPEAWKIIGKNIGYGVAVMCSVLQPEAVVFGGGVGAYADKFIPTVKAYLDDNLHAVVRHPKALLTAKLPEEAVIYGCYELAKDHHEQPA